MENSVQSSVTCDLEFKKSKWFSMKNTIQELVSKVTIFNVRAVAKEIMNQENLIEGRGLFCQAIMKSQMEFPEKSNIYASLVAIINSQFPDVGLLLVKRVVAQFTQADSDNNKKKLKDILKLLAQLVNQLVVYEILAIDVMLFLLGNPSSDNVEISVWFCTQCGALLQDFAPHKLKEIFQVFLHILNKGKLEKRVQLLILRLFKIRKSNFKNYPTVVDGLEFVDEIEDQVTHEVSLLHDTDPETSLDDFNPKLFELVNNYMLDFDGDDEVTSLRMDGDENWDFGECVDAHEENMEDT